MNEVPATVATETEYPELALGTIHQADARALPLETSSIDGVGITSPPYWRLREYGDDDREAGRGSLETYLAETLDALDELGRVLVDDALVWWNVGDTRTGSGGAGGDYQAKGGRAGRRGFRQVAADRGGLARGQWALVPPRFALGAQDRGWLVLADVTWSKGKVRLRKGVPELVTRRRPEDLHHVKRPGISSERIYLLARTLDARRRFRPSMLEELGDVWTFPPDAEPGRRKHDAPFPPELVRRCLLPSTLPGDVVIDPYAGTGTTIRVAERHGRQAIGFDLYAPSSEVAKPEPSQVIGCVWGAHRKLVETHGDDAPPYAWCEERWHEIRKRAPADNALPAWLEMELFFAWRGRPDREVRPGVTLGDLAAINLRPAVFYYAARRIADGELLDLVAQDLKLTTEQVSYIDERTRPCPAS